MTSTQYDNPFDEDVEVPEEVNDGDVELEEVDVPDENAPAAAEGKAKEPKAPARPPVPEGFITPVAFAKVLTEHLEAKGYSNSKGAVNATNPIPPQMVYSYLKNSGEGSKNPWPRYEEGGRKNLLKADESLAWWDALVARVAASKATAKEKADKKAAKANETPVVEAEATPVEVVEAE